MGGRLPTNTRSTSRARAATSPASDNDSGAGAGPSSGGGLPPSVVNDLEAQGADGAGAAKLAQSTGPDKGKGDGARHAAASTNPGDSGGGVGEVLNQLAGGDGESDGGMGVALPIILGASLLAAVTLLLLRRRGTGPGERRVSDARFAGSRGLSNALAPRALMARAALLALPIVAGLASSASAAPAPLDTGFSDSLYQSRTRSPAASGWTRP